MGWFWRNKVSTNFERQLFDQLAKMGFHVAQNGTEHTHPAFVDKLKQSTDQTSLAIRYQPDGVASIGSIPQSFYIEAKTTSEPGKAHTIEKNAWEQYWRLRTIGNIVVIAFGEFLDRGEWDQEDYNFVWRWNFLEKIKFRPSAEVVGRFPADKQFPIIDGWICPRGSEREAELRASGNHNSSGTPYKEVVTESLLSWDTFKQLIVKRLEIG